MLPLQSPPLRTETGVAQPAKIHVPRGDAKCSPPRTKGVVELHPLPLVSSAGIARERASRRTAD